MDSTCVHQSWQKLHHFITYLVFGIVSYSICYQVHHLICLIDWNILRLGYRVFNLYSSFFTWIWNRWLLFLFLYDWSSFSFFICWFLSYILSLFYCLLFLPLLLFLSFFINPICFCLSNKPCHIQSIIPLYKITTILIDLYGLT